MKYVPLPKNINDWPDWWRFLFNERAGMIEHHGCLPKNVSERNSEKQVRAMHRRRFAK